MSEWNKAIDAAQDALPEGLRSILEPLKKQPPACLHPELIFNSGDYYVMCPACNSKWVRVKPGGLESGMDAQGRQVGGDTSVANQGQAAGLSGHRRVEPA
jgi:hypothetical protein